jgi:L-ascorbate metabolism protein UlaG (beta-lactamase superfamily)
MDIHYRWLGTAGLEFTWNDQTLLIDPFFTRPALIKILLNQRVQPDMELVKTYLKRADWVLVSHCHYDHVMDVPNILRQFGAVAAGSTNTCTLLKRSGIPERQIRFISAGDYLEFGPFQIEVLPSWHVKTPIDFMINGPLAPNMQFPLHLADYRMDVDFGFIIQMGDLRILVGNESSSPVDMAFIMPFCPPALLAKLLSQANPREVIPIHWDNFFRPLSRPLVPLPFKSLRVLENHVLQHSTRSQVHVVEALKSYSLTR